MQVVDYNVGKGQLLGLSALLKASLHNTATMLVGTDFDAIVDAGIENELGESLILLAAFTVGLFWVLRGLEYAQEGLNYMISVSTLFNLYLKSTVLTKLNSLIYGYRY